MQKVFFAGGNVWFTMHEDYHSETSQGQEIYLIYPDHIAKYWTHRGSLLNLTESKISANSYSCLWS